MYTYTLYASLTVRGAHAQDYEKFPQLYENPLYCVGKVHRVGRCT